MLIVSIKNILSQDWPMSCHWCQYNCFQLNTLTSSFFWDIFLMNSTNNPYSFSPILDCFLRSVFYIQTVSQCCALPMLALVSLSLYPSHPNISTTIYWPLLGNTEFYWTMCINHYLQELLFLISKSYNIIKARKRTWCIILVIFLHVLCWPCPENMEIRIKADSVGLENWN